MNSRGASFGTIMAIIGSSLIALGVAWLIADNWHQIPSVLKVIILLAATAAAFVCGTLFRLRDYDGIGKALHILGSLLYTLSIFLIAQIYHLATGVQGYAALLLLAWIGVVVAAYIFESSVSLVIAFVEFLIWVILQFFAFYENTGYYNDISVGMVMVLFLTIGVLFFGISLWHRLKNLDFAQLYQGWTAFYFLLFGYLLSFQLLLPLLWSSSGERPVSVVVFLWVFGVLAALTLLSGIFYGKGNSSKWELGGFSLLVVLLIIVLSLATILTNNAGTCAVRSCQQVIDEQSCSRLDNICQWQNNACSDRNCYQYTNQTFCQDAKCTWNAPSGFCSPSGVQNSCANYYQMDSCNGDGACQWYAQTGRYWGGNQQVPPALWLIWVIANVVFIVVILAVIGFGTWANNVFMINLGIIFFALEIITRYIGFIMRLWGYTSLALIFISGGIILIAGGWGIEKWRRTLITKAKK